MHKMRVHANIHVLRQKVWWELRRCWRVLFRCDVNWLWRRERKSSLITALASGYHWDKYTVFGMDIHVSVSNRLLLLCVFEVLPANAQGI